MDLDKFLPLALENHIQQFTAQREMYRNMIRDIRTDDPAYDTIAQLIRDFDKYASDQWQTLSLFRNGHI